jgi:PTS system beta-glucosides-specific IIC component
MFSKKNAHITLLAPLEGTVISLSGVEDEVFSKKILGDGFAIIPSSNEIYAPIDAKIDTVFETGHAISMTADCGSELLIHCGIDTVKLSGKGFEPVVKAGQRVKAGELLLKFDPNVIKAGGFLNTTPVVILNSDRFTISSISSGDCRVGDKIAELEEKKNK